MEDGVLIEGPLALDDLFQVTIQSTTAAGASRNIPYSVFHQGIEAGLLSWSYTLTRSDNGLPIANARVWVSSDASGNSIVASGVTNASGVVTFLLENGSTVYVWREAPGFSFTPQPDVEVVS